MNKNPELDKEDFPNSEYATNWATQMVENCDKENLIYLIASLIDSNKNLKETSRQTEKRGIRKKKQMGLLNEINKSTD